MWHVWASFSLNLFKTCQADAEGFIQVSITDVIRWHLKQELKPTATICQLLKQFDRLITYYSTGFSPLLSSNAISSFWYWFVFVVSSLWGSSHWMWIWNHSLPLIKHYPPTPDDEVRICALAVSCSVVFMQSVFNALNFWVARVPEITSFKKSLVWLCTWPLFPIYKALTMSMWFLHNGLRCRASTWHQRGAALWE